MIRERPRIGAWELVDLAGNEYYDEEVMFVGLREDCDEALERLLLSRETGSDA